MNAHEAIVGRRNIKQFKPDPIPNGELNEWLEAAAFAPSHRLTEPWEVLWIGPKTREMLNHSTDFGGAPVVIAVLSAPGKTQQETDENIVSAACFAQNLTLEAHAAGAGTRWTSIGYTERGREILGVAADHSVIGVIAIGYPAEVPTPKSRTPMAEKIKELP